MVDKRIQEIIIDTHNGNIVWDRYEPDYSWIIPPEHIVLGQFQVLVGKGHLDNCFVAEIPEGRLYMLEIMTSTEPYVEFCYRLFLETEDDIVEVTKRVMEAVVICDVIKSKFNDSFNIECYKVGSVVIEKISYNSCTPYYRYFFDRNSGVYDVVFSEAEERWKRTLLSWKEIIGERTVSCFLSPDGSGYEMSY